MVFCLALNVVVVERNEMYTVYCVDEVNTTANCYRIALIETLDRLELHTSVSPGLVTSKLFRPSARHHRRVACWLFVPSGRTRSFSPNSQATNRSFEMT